MTLSVHTKWYASPSQHYIHSCIQALLCVSVVALAENASPMTLKDLAAQAGLPASRAHPYLVSFAKLGLVEQRRADAQREASRSGKEDEVDDE